METITPKFELFDVRSIRLLVSRLHSIFRDNDSQSNIINRFDEITKLIFTKIVADKAQKDGFVTPFLISGNSVNTQAIRDYYYELAMQYKDLIPVGFSKLCCSDQAIYECVLALQSFDFSSTHFDFKGLAYEEVIRNTFDKGDHQQFFTPPHIVEFIVSLCKPYIKGDVCDPASGTGGFLSSIARHKLNYSSLTSIEIDERLSWISGINMLLHEAKNIHKIFLPDGGTLGADIEKYFSSFDTIITNPPFGSDFTDSKVLKTMKLGLGKSSRRRGILFIERCHSLLRENGILAIVVEEGILNQTLTVDVRRFITENFDIKVVVTLPDTSFMPYATVNTSIIVLSKKKISNPNAQKIFFAKAETVGRKPNGDDDIQYNQDGTSYLNSDFPEILSAWHKYIEDGIINPKENIYVTDIDLINTKEENSYRIDFQYNHSSRKVSSELISSCAYPVKYLKDICIERNVSIVLSKNLGGTIIRYTGLANIEPHTGYVEQILTPADSLKSSVKIYKPGDIIFAKMRPNLRKVALMDFSESGYVSSECSVFSVRQNSDGTPIIDPLLLSILLRSNFVYGQIMHLVTGIGRPRINSRDINQIIIPIPPKKNQHKIYQNLLNQRLKAEKLKLEAESLIEMSQNIIKSSVKELVTCFISDNYEI